jgi:DNA-binding CsgD family transcriptional regulator
VSAFTDRERREDAADAAIERGKAKLRLLQSVLTQFAEGLSARETAERLHISERSVVRYRRALEMTPRYDQARKPAESAAVDPENVSSQW